jgi:hypothetical protein
VLNIEKIGRRVRVIGDDLLDVGTHERQWLGREGEVQRRIGRILVEIVRRLDRTLVEVGSGKRSWVADDRDVALLVVGMTFEP